MEYILAIIAGYILGRMAIPLSPLHIKESVALPRIHNKVKILQKKIPKPPIKETEEALHKIYGKDQETRAKS